MRALGILHIVLGILALTATSFTLLAATHAGDAGFLVFDANRPHSILLNPIVGIVAALDGVAMLIADRWATTG